MGRMDWKSIVDKLINSRDNVDSMESKIQLFEKYTYNKSPDTLLLFNV
jgi:hypothetical protein